MSAPRRDEAKCKGNDDGSKAEGDAVADVAIVVLVGYTHSGAGRSPTESSNGRNGKNESTSPDKSGVRKRLRAGVGIVVTISVTVVVLGSI